MHLSYRTVAVDGLDIFYRQAGDPKLPTLLLLHGFPSSGHMFRDLIPLLADKFHLVAPDFPGFGKTSMPARDKYAYTFANLSKTIGSFTEVIGLRKFAIYVFDYGSPVGLRIALNSPEKISAIITQNGNAYEEGLSQGWEPIQKYWKDASQANRDGLRAFLQPESIAWQYTHGVPDPSSVSPDGHSLDSYYLTRPDAHEVQLDLFKDYATNVDLYPKFQEYFRKNKPPLLAVWGKNDPFFLPPGAEAFKRDIPNAQVHFYDTGHFALETHSKEIAEKIIPFLQSAK